MFKNQHYKKANGFTLLELMVTLAIAAIVLTIAVPSFTGMIVRNSLTSEANEFLSAFSLARNEAIKLNQNTRLCHSADSEVCTASTGSGWQGWLIIDTANRVIASGYFRESMVVSGTVNTDVIQFSAGGLVRNSTTGAPLSGAITICNPSNQVNDNARVINFVSGGRVSVNAVAIVGCS